jgi:hypothetical protein
MRLRIYPESGSATALSIFTLALGTGLAIAGIFSTSVVAGIPNVVARVILVVLGVGIVVLGYTQSEKIAERDRMKKAMEKAMEKAEAKRRQCDHEFEEITMFIDGRGGDGQMYGGAETYVVCTKCGLSRLKGFAPQSACACPSCGTSMPVFAHYCGVCGRQLPR